MRKALVDGLIHLAKQDPRIVLLTGDLGYTVIEPFQQHFPDRFYNVGVAEQNMVGLATGLAEAGYIPFVYSIVTFATLRPYEFIRNGPILHNLPVRIVGVGGGVEYGPAGPTHHGLEDVAVFRHYPNMDIFAPADAEQLKSILNQCWDRPGPAYYRIGKFENLQVPGLDGQYEFDTINTVVKGSDVLLLSMGSISTEVVSAATSLQALGVSAQVAIVSQINPLPKQALLDSLRGFSCVCTIEGHLVTGGLGSAIAELIAESSVACKFKRYGIQELGTETTGGYNYLINRAGLDANSLCEQIHPWVQQK